MTVPRKGLPDSPEGPASLLDTVEGRRYAMEQAQASSRLEGYVHTPEDRESAERYIRGEITLDEFRAEALTRARRLEEELQAISPKPES